MRGHARLLWACFCLVGVLVGGAEGGRKTRWICSGYLGYLYPPCLFYEPTWATADLRLNETLATRLFGQAHVVAPLSAMFARHFAPAKTGSATQTTSFHLAGDNGCGKSFCVSLLAEAAFGEERESHVLVLSGENYIGSSPQECGTHRQTLFRQIVAQLKREPWSLIVIDDVQYVHSNTLVVLQQFMDPSTSYVVDDEGTPVDKSRALIGIVSDFGTEGQSLSMSFHELERLVLDHASELWGVAANSKQLQLIQYTVPFRTLGLDAVAKVSEAVAVADIPRLVPTISRVIMSPGAAQQIALRVLQAFPHENGRGASKWILRYLLQRVRDFQKRTGKQTSAAFTLRVDEDPDPSSRNFGIMLRATFDTSDLDSGEL